MAAAAFHGIGEGFSPLLSFVDGALIAAHGGDYYPRSAMSINFNLCLRGGIHAWLPPLASPCDL